MSDSPRNKKNYVLKTFILASVIFMADILVPGQVAHENIKQIKKEVQKYFNAAGNSHFSHKVVTENIEFYVDEDFARSVQPNEEITFSKSRIFQKVNWYQTSINSDKSRYSLRLMSGFLVPFIFLVTVFFSIRFKKNLSTLLFVLQLLLILDLIYLIL